MGNIGFKISREIAFSYQRSAIRKKKKGRKQDIAGSFQQGFCSWELKILPVYPAFADKI